MEKLTRKDIKIEKLFLLRQYFSNELDGFLSLFVRLEFRGKWIYRESANIAGALVDHMLDCFIESFNAVVFL